MAVNRQLTAAADGERPAWPSLGNGTAKADTALSFGSGNQKPGMATPKDNKRKATDASLEIITIDNNPDLTLNAGTPGNTGGQKAFKINRVSFRSACNAWATMLNGKWSESNQYEICFPDDSPFAFQVVLQIAHWQFNVLPINLT
jgi:hypothetical protein